MDILSVRDVKQVSGIIHDSEFGEGDFGYNAKDKIFTLTTNSPAFRRKFFLFETRSQDTSGEKFHLEFRNVVKYRPEGLTKIKAGKGTGGVFNYIRVRKKGQKLTLVSQDLSIELELSKLEGRFERIKERK